MKETTADDILRLWHETLGCRFRRNVCAFLFGDEIIDKRCAKKMQHRQHNWKHRHSTSFMMTNPPLASIRYLSVVALVSCSSEEDEKTRPTD